MFNRNLLIALSSALLLVVGAPAMAQNAPATGGVTRNTGETTITGETVLPGRIGGRDRQNSERQQSQRQRGRPAAAPNPEQVKAAAQALATAANTGCTVGEASLRGENPEKQSVYEATCATGPGFILIGSTPPQAFDCVVLFGQADITRSHDAAADVGLQCMLPANNNVLAVVTGYAHENGVTCTIDQGSTVGKSTAGNIVYEVGCAGSDGYWLEKTATGWTKTECLKLVSQNATCKYTTPAEQAATVKTWLAGSEAAACDVTQARYMGANANGSFYEAKCGSGDGYVARFDTAMAVQQVYPCATAQRIGGGCTLTVVPAAEAPAPAAAPTTQR